MAIAKPAPQIGLRLIPMADGSVSVATERGEILAMQTGVTLRSSPGGQTVATVEFVVDHDKFRLESPGSSITIQGKNLSDGLDAAFIEEIRKITERLNERKG